ncbi:MAG: patatin-like phospholipase family protein [Pseudomonadota bacterium]
MQPLSIQAGPAALTHLRDHGFRGSDVRAMAGASGGAKWLVLAGIDKVLIEHLLPTLTAPVHLLGSSIGSWRFACYAQAKPRAALARLEQAYVEQTYSEKPDRHEISTVGRDMLAHIIGDAGAAEIVANPTLRTHIMAVRARHLCASERAPVLLTGLTAAMLANLARRRALGWFFERALVHDTRTRPPFLGVDDFPIQRIALQAANVIPAVQASGAIPMVLNGVSPLPGAKPGVYRDGGIIDYHFDLPLSCDSGLTLYPHFYEHLTPGWFDKRLTRRRPTPEHLDRVILIAPSKEFVAQLPFGKIPDRNDFKALDTETRLRYWRKVLSESDRLGEALLRWMQSDDPGSQCRPLA